MEDDLNFLENGGQPHFFLNLEMNGRPSQFKVIGRWPPFQSKWKTTLILKYMEDNHR